MGKFSRDKGKRGELSFCHLCEDNGITGVARTAQCKGKTGAAGDVEGLAGFHVECKAVERLNLREAMAQSVRDSEAEGAGNIPIVAHKKNRDGWLVTMRAEDFFKIYKENRGIE